MKDLRLRRTNPYLLVVGVALLLVCEPHGGAVAQTGGAEGQVGQSHQLFLSAEPGQSLRLAIRHHVHLRDLLGRGRGGAGVQGVVVRLRGGLACEHPLLDDRGDSGFRHLEGVREKLC